MKIDRRRRRENKTDYLTRMKLLKGNRPRLVFRKTNKYVIVQYIKSHEAQDKVVISMDSRKLLDYGWPKEFKGSLKSIPASYLIGYLIGKQIKKQKLEEPIIDLGMLRTINKTKIYGFIKGVIEAGINIKCKKEAFPEENRIQGKNLKEDFSKKFSEIKSKIEKA